MLQQALQSYTHKLPSEHSLMTTFVTFNKKRDKFITCGQDGEINIYSLSQPSTQTLSETTTKQITRIAYANMQKYSYRRFDEVIVCIKWADLGAGDCVAVGGSRGGLVIFRVDYFTGSIVVEKGFHFGGSVPCSVDWHPEKPLLMVGTMDGYCYTITSDTGQWSFAAQPIYLGRKGEVYVSFCAPGSNYQVAAVHDTVYQILLNENKYVEAIKLTGEKILGLLSRTQGMEKYIQLYILTDKKLHSYESTASTQTPSKQFLKKLQQLPTQSHRCDQLSWGWTQSQLLLYCTGLPNVDKFDKSQDYLRAPIVLKRKLNGRFVMKL